MRWLVWTLLLGVMCVGLDHLHATHGVVSYPEHFRQVWGQPFWAWPLFIGSAGGALFAGRTIRRWVGDASRPPWREVAGDIISFVLVYASTSFLYTHPRALTGVIVGFWLVRVLRAPLWVTIASVVSGLVGPLVEVLISSAGGFTYLCGETFGIPYWLPGIYLYAGVVAATLAGRLSPLSTPTDPASAPARG